jgi:hypothetical protein
MRRLYCLVLTFVMLTGEQAGAEVHLNWKRSHADMGRGCNITMKFPISEKGRLIGDRETRSGGLSVRPIPESWKSKLGELYIDLNCKTAIEPDAEGAKLIDSGAKYNRQTKQWEKHLDSWFSPGDLIDPESRVDADKETRLINIHAVNSRGYAQLTYQSFGEERFRLRQMYFCLFRSERALCGHGNVAYLGDGARGDLTPHVLKILESVKFLDDVPEATPEAGK